MSAGSLIGTGISLGIVHVLTGPDHLSALVTLTAPEDSWRKSFWMGLQWGVGHSTGLLVVGGILIGISSGDTIDFPHTLTVVLESLVGVFMVALGLYGMYRAIRKHHQQIEASDDIAATEKQDSDNGEEEEGTKVENSLLDEDVVANNEDVIVDEELALQQQQQRDRTTTTTTSAIDQIIEYEPITSIVEGTDEVDLDVSNNTEENDEDDGDNLSRMQKCRLLFRKWSTACLALGAGLLHGLVGPGGVLGVIPAVQIRDPALGALYLGTFCIASTLTMGTFAVLYGGLTATFSKVTSHRFEHRVEMASAILSIVVGILWLVLVGTGKMEDFFE